MNSVQKIAFQFAGTSQAFFSAMYARWDNFWLTQLEQSTERIFSKLDDVDHVLALDALELDLGDIEEKDFEQRFIALYEQQLEDALLKLLYENSPVGLRKVSLKQNLSALLFQFLLHGSLPWNTSSDYKNIDSLFTEVAKTDSRGLRHFLQRYGHYTSLQQRLVLQLEEETLTIGIRVIAPTEGVFILSYVRFVQSRYKKLNSPKIGQSPYKEAVWQVVYAWLLTNRSSFFNRKVFLEHTIRQLAHRYLTTYLNLLNLLLYSQHKDNDYSLELFQLLNALKAEHKTDHQWNNNWLQLHHLLRGINTRDEEKGTLGLDWKRKVSNLLRNESTNYLLLQTLKEKQILKLVQLLIPQQYTFVATYAQELDRQKDRGLLQGKTGTGFHLLKWQIMFPILLADNGLGFNRHHFVQQVLQKVAGHYNLRMVDILQYLNLQVENLSISKELCAILEELYARFNLKTAHHQQDTVWDIQQITKALSGTHNLEIDIAPKWKQLLKDETIRNRLLVQLKEHQHEQLVKMLYGKESRFLLAYVATIKQQQQKGILQGKTSGRYQHLKWRFLHDVLYESQNQSFNKKHIVERTFKKIGSHYNLSIKELLIYFYRETQNKGFGLPYQLIKIIADLYQEYTGVPLPEKTIHQSAELETKKREDKSYNLLERYLGSEPGLKKMRIALAQNTEFVAYLEPVLQVYSALCNFMLLHNNIRVNHRQILALLLRLAANYNKWSRVEVLIKVITLLSDHLKSEEQQEQFSQQLQHMAALNPFLKDTIALKEKLLKEANQPLAEPEDDIEAAPPVLSFVNNAGLVLLAPFLPRLFQLLNLTENGKIKDKNAYIKALYLMQYAVFGTSEFSEHELQLNKLLTSFHTVVPVPRKYLLTDQEKETVDQMLNGAMQHWGKVKTVEGLREGFLQREGKLEEKEEEFELTVEAKAFDMLLDSLPWSFRTIKFSWMEKAIQVKWR
ncbi:contractile injection system tape measure protein [Pedobacter sp. ASV28]|uniref:contractile injection system tape measure protein n=1 Tax=Pedobacter sp. ASV28 TaxID=2795123 RepID=UPI0018EE4212|nr:contractile injection system tape measure protein [Pedobacter sp. ASV28]